MNNQNPPASRPPLLKEFRHAVTADKQFVRLKFTSKDGSTFECLITEQDAKDMAGDLLDASKRMTGP